MGELPSMKEWLREQIKFAEEKRDRLKAELRRANDDLWFLTQIFQVVEKAEEGVV